MALATPESRLVVSVQTCAVPSASHSTIAGKPTACRTPVFSLGQTQDVLFDLYWTSAESPERFGAVTFYLDAPSARSMHQCMFDAFSRTQTNGKNGKVRPM